MQDLYEDSEMVVRCVCYDEAGVRQESLWGTIMFAADTVICSESEAKQNTCV